MHSRPYAQHSKVQLFWEGHKNLCNRPHGFDIYLVNVNIMTMIAQIFVAFSGNLNFTNLKKYISLRVKILKTD